MFETSLANLPELGRPVGITFKDDPKVYSLEEGLLKVAQVALSGTDKYVTRVYRYEPGNILPRVEKVIWENGGFSWAFPSWYRPDAPGGMVRLSSAVGSPLVTAKFDPEQVATRLHATLTSPISAPSPGGGGPVGWFLRDDN